jgi:hypothetical protein
MNTGSVVDVTTGGVSEMKTLTFLSPKSNAGGWCPPCANALGSTGSTSNIDAKNVKANIPYNLDLGISASNLLLQYIIVI